MLGAGEGTFGCLWVPWGTLSPKNPTCSVTAQSGWLFSMWGWLCRWRGLVFLSCHPSVALHSWCFVTGSERLESGLQPAVLHPGSLGFPVNATSHIYDTDIKEAEEIEVRCGLLFLHIYPEERTCYSILKLMFMHHFTLSRLFAVSEEIFYAWIYSRHIIYYIWYVCSYLMTTSYCPM